MFLWSEMAQIQVTKCVKKVDQRPTSKASVHDLFRGEQCAVNLRLVPAVYWLTTLSVGSNAKCGVCVEYKSSWSNKEKLLFHIKVK
jgi:hypothetical protein